MPDGDSHGGALRSEELPRTPFSGIAPGPAVPGALNFEGRRAMAAVTARLTGRNLAVRVGRYQIGAPLGQGGFATVYAGRDPDLDRQVAIKVLRGSQCVDEAIARERLVREARALAQLEHPNIVEIYDAGIAADPEHGTSFHLVMELLTGPTLSDWVADEKPPVARILAAYTEAARGLAAAHAVGVVHRDFKPSNVMFAADGRAKVLDFGLADTGAIVDATPSSASDDSLSSKTDQVPLSLTQTGAVMGTPRYMAPEQHKAKLATTRSDQYAFCVALWESLTGRPPFDGTTIAKLAVQKSRAEPPPKPATLSTRLYRALCRGLAPDPDRRYPTMAELIATLGAGPRHPRRHFVWLGGASIAAAVGVLSMSLAADPLCARHPDWASRFDAAVERLTPSPTDPRWGDQERARLRMERFATQWVDAQQEICDGASSTEAALAPCVLAGADRFDALLDAVDAADGEAALAMTRRFLALPPPSHCTKSTGAELYAIDPQVEAQADAYAAIAHHWVADGELLDGAELDAQVAAASALGDDTLAVQMLVARARQHEMAAEIAEAASTLEQAIWRAEAAGDPLLAVESYPQFVAFKLDGSTPPQIEAMFERADALLEAAGHPRGPELGIVSLRGVTAVRSGQIQRAIELGAEFETLAGDPVYPGAERWVAGGMTASLLVQSQLMEPAAQEQALRRALRLSGVHAPANTMAHVALSDLALSRGDIDGAMTRQFVMLEGLSQRIPAPSAPTMTSLAEHGRLLVFRGSDELGEALMRYAYNWIGDSVGPLDGKLAQISHGAARANLDRDRPDLALWWAERELGHLQHMYGPNHYETLWARATLTRALVRVGELDRADAELAKAFALLQGGPNDAHMRPPLITNRGELALARGQFAAARKDLEAVAVGFEPTTDPAEQGAVGDIEAKLVHACRALGDTDCVVAQERRAIQHLSNGSYFHRLRADRLRASLPPQRVAQLALAP